jgi:hypothetical protein
MQSFILNPVAIEEAVEKPVMSAHLAAFIEAAFTSAEPITIDQLKEMVESEARVKILSEGILRAKAGEFANDLKGAGTDIAGWFKGVEEKNRTIQEKCDELVTWLKDEEKENPNLSLDMGSFKSWMKTSEYGRWRHYFMLNDAMFSRIMKNIKDDKRTELEDWVADFDTMAERKVAGKLIENARTISDLVKIVERYKARAAEFAKGILARKSSINGAPFHVVLLGFVDLDSTVKKIVRLAK